MSILYNQVFWQGFLGRANVKFLLILSIFIQGMCYYIIAKIKWRFFNMSNPVLANVIKDNNGYISSTPMTVDGTVNKLFLMFAILCVSFGVVFYQYSLGFIDKVEMLMKVGVFAGFVLAMIIIFTRKALNILVPIYAFCEGMFLGGLSAVFEAQMPGIVMQAVALTFLALFSLLGLYKAGVIRATEKFRSTILIATVAIGIFYVAALVMSFFKVQIPVLYSSTPVGITFSVIVCIIAALNLIWDFDFIERGAMSGIDKQYEWYGAFGLMVTLVWLYVEILRLLSKLNRR